MKSENKDKLAKLEHMVEIAHYCIGTDMAKYYCIEAGMAKYTLTPKTVGLFELMCDCNEVLDLIKNGKVKIEESKNNERN